MKKLPVTLLTGAIGPATAALFVWVLSFTNSAIPLFSNWGRYGPGGDYLILITFIGVLWSILGALEWHRGALQFEELLGFLVSFTMSALVCGLPFDHIPPVPLISATLVTLMTTFICLGIGLLLGFLISLIEPK